METETASYFGFVLAACFGGGIVLVGLVMETLSEKKWFKNVKTFRQCESIKRYGEWVVIGGILFEVVVAGVFANEEWHIKTSQEVRIITEKEGERFINYLKDKPKGTVRLGVLVNMSSKTKALTDQIYDLLTQAGYPVKNKIIERFLNDVPSCPPDTTLQIIVHTPSDRPAYADALTNAFSPV